MVIDGVVYHTGDFVFLRPGVFDELQDANGASGQVADYASKGRFHKGGANAGLRPYGIAQLIGLNAFSCKKKASKVKHLVPSSRCGSSHTSRVAEP